MELLKVGGTVFALSLVAIQLTPSILYPHCDESVCDDTQHIFVVQSRHTSAEQWSVGSCSCEVSAISALQQQQHLANRVEVWSAGWLGP